MKPNNQRNELNPTGMCGRVELVTPALAAAWLEMTRKGGNRTLRKKRLEKYCKDRKENNWHLHHQGIAFDTDGKLCDGQHRLNMVIQTGLPTIMYVVRNVPISSVTHVDEQLPRSIKDAIRMANQGDFTHSIIATAGIIERLPNEYVNTGMYGKEDIICMIEKHREALEFSERFHGKRITRAVRCLIARAFYTYGEDERLELFGRWLSSAIGTPPKGHQHNEEEDEAIATYLKYLQACSNKALNDEEVTKYRKGQDALKAFMERKPHERCVSSSRDLFPLPEGMVLQRTTPITATEPEDEEAAAQPIGA